ncbi:uncharacterized protein PSANT_04970 [Moesziomyces antarcticus]|uniref:Helicase ATP-binding domain-containing protein n=1 Tax=Pseudozyma antarctica TaxID=84753 RepID=A0A5C3FSK9_PSEA2|nr:uncharacterized protein PSANT_04970 [Moesziomyces antarcticus]
MPRDKLASASELSDPSESLGGEGNLWRFLQACWLYGYPNCALDDIFQRALTINRTSAKTKGNYCPVETSIHTKGSDKPQTEDGIWLPLYADGMAGDEASLLQTSISYGCKLHKRRTELQVARDAEEARQAALTAEAKRRLAAKQSKQKGKAASFSATRAKRSRAPPQPEDMDEEQDELESDSKEEEVVQAETNAEEALRLVGRQVKPDTWRTKAEGKTWKHVADNPSLVKHLSAIKDVPKDVSFTNIVAVKVDLEDTSGSIAVDQEAGQVEHDIRGIDGDLTSDEAADSFAIPSKAALAQYEPFDLTKLGYRTHPLDAKLDKALRQRLTLSETQLQSGLWFFRKVAFDIRKTSALRQQMEALSDEELFDRRDWSTGGIVADPPGLGKTVIAILFALIYRKLKVSNKPCLFIVKTSVSQQFGKEVFRFVDVTLGDVSDGELHLLSLTKSNDKGKRVPREFKDNDRTMWNADLLVVVSNKNTAPKAKKDPRLPFHTSWKYGLVCYNEVHDLPQTTAGTFSMEYNVQREFTVGFSGTPIRNVEHFLFVMAFCGHPAAKIGTAEKARSLGRAISNSMTLDEADRENVGRVFRDNILQWTTQRDVSLIGRGGDLTALETLVSRLYGERMPQEQHLASAPFSSTTPPAAEGMATQQLRDRRPCTPVPPSPTISAHSSPQPLPLEPSTLEPMIIDLTRSPSPPAAGTEQLIGWSPEADESRICAQSPFLANARVELERPFFDYVWPGILTLGRAGQTPSRSVAASSRLCR